MRVLCRNTESEIVPIIAKTFTMFLEMLNYLGVYKLESKLKSRSYLTVLVNLRTWVQLKLWAAKNKTQLHIPKYTSRAFSIEPRNHSASWPQLWLCFHFYFSKFTLKAHFNACVGTTYFLLLCFLL